ncbi:coiled-coil domain-containing protein 40-like [Pollicipes pollicipes]|uniref:coiled-coil domain-containing protein 40-like n=1 Tax=Pollicipes pollicipes TaxID=41117 RepID=UPI001884F9EA|nr:coiled-coil domain-containing protein 40-like [Pollicipes pollicipes]
MARFQRALAGLLRRQIGQLDLDLVQLRKEQRACTKHREATGVQLYERQLQLARLQEQQQQLQEQLQAAVEARGATERSLVEVRRQHKEHADKLEADRRREKELRVDVGTLEKHEYHLKSLENDADTELQLRQKMAERADAEMAKLEQDKQRQDFLIARLSSDADRLRTAIRLNQVQSRAQTEECTLARQVLAEAQLELETLVMEKRHLTQTWTNSLNTMQKRDEEYARLHGNITKMSADLHTVDGEIAGYIRSIAQAQDNNEQLMMQLRRLQAERDKFQRAYDQMMELFGMQKEEYARFHHALTDTEDKLFQCQTEQKACGAAHEAPAGGHGEGDGPEAPAGGHHPGDDARAPDGRQRRQVHRQDRAARLGTSPSTWRDRWRTWRTTSLGYCCPSATLPPRSPT